MRPSPKVGAFYKHFKGMEYRILAVNARSSDQEDNKPYVVYEALYGDHSVWIRPTEEFMSEVDKSEYPDVEQKYRFEETSHFGDDFIWA